MAVKTCPRGHAFTKGSASPTCPVCEAAPAPASDLLAGLGAPARRALERAGIDTLAKLAKRSERELLALHGVGPSAIPKLKLRLAAAGLALRSESKGGANAKPGAGDAVVLLSGGNPQIAKADGDAPVQAYIAAMPGWKRDVGRRLDALIARTVPDVRKAVRWNSPFYGVAGQGWFLAFHCFAKYVKVTFLRGTSLRPLPPVASKVPNTRYLHVHEVDQLDEKLVTSWIRQAAALPGDPLF